MIVMKKGISPLIAAVILIAFVVAVASVVATFFTDIAGEWGEDIEGAQPVECAMMNLEVMDFSTEVNETNGNDNASLSFRSTGSPLTEVTINIYSGEVHSGSIDLMTYEEPEEEPVEEGRTITLDLVEEDVIGEEFVETIEEDDTVEVVSLDCPGVTEEYTVQEEDRTTVE